MAFHVFTFHVHHRIHISLALTKYEVPHSSTRGYQSQKLHDPDGTRNADYSPYLIQPDLSLWRSRGQAIRAHVTPEPTPRLLYRCHTFIHTGRLVWWQKTRTCVYERAQCTSCTSNTKPWRSDLQCSSEGVPQRPVHCLAVGRVISTRLPTTTGKSWGLQTYGQRQSTQSPHGIASEEGHSQ